MSWPFLMAALLPVGESGLPEGPPPKEAEPRQEDPSRVPEWLLEGELPFSVEVPDILAAPGPPNRSQRRERKKKRGRGVTR
jgi:hypothetical protein